MKWKQLSPEAQSFYKSNLNFMKRIGTNWDVIPDAEMGTPIPDAQTMSYRVNLKKVTLINECPVFFNFIPKLADGLFDKVWYTDAAQGKQSIPHATWAPGGAGAPTENFLKTVYCQVFRGNAAAALGAFGMANLPNAWTPKINAFFNINVDRLIRRRLYRLQQLLSGKSQAEVSKGPFISLADKNVWYRTPDGRLYTNTDKGQVFYDEESVENARVLTSNFKCYSTLLQGTQDECKKYMYQCLLNANSDEISDCLQYWNRKDFYTVSVSEIKSMHPLVALRTLQKFGFREHDVHDNECGRKLRKVETKEHWVKNYMSTKFNGKVDGAGKKVEEIISQNDKLLDYLQLLVEYVNANPAILNKDYSGKTSESQGVVNTSDLAQRLGLRMQMLPAGSYRGLSDYSRLKSMITSFHSKPRMGMSMGMGQGYPSYTGPVYNSPYATQQLGVGLPFQLGGNDSAEMGQYLKRIDQRKITGPEALVALINGTLDELKQSGKTLDERDRTEIAKKADVLVQTEKELIKAGIYLEEYDKQVKLFGDYTPEMLSLDSMQKLVEKRENLYKRQESEETNLLRILGKLQGELQKKKEFVEENDEGRYRNLNL